MKQFLLYFGATVGFGVLAVVGAMFFLQRRTPEIDTPSIVAVEVEDVPASPTKPKDPSPRTAPMNSEMAPRPMSPASMATSVKVVDLASVPLPKLTEVSGRPQNSILNRMRDRQIQKRFSDSDRLLVLHLSVMSPSSISVVNVANGQEVWNQQTDLELRAAAVSTDGKMIAIAERGGKLTCYDAATGTVTQAIDGPTPVGGAENVTDLRFDETGQKIITAHYDRTVRTWDIASQKEVSRLQIGDH